ncbi:MAG: TonB-dependent receptor [Gammaproteobacteria bacterium]
MKTRSPRDSFPGTWLPTEALTLTAGVRLDHFDSVGSAFTWRAGLAWMAWPDTKLRATYGTGFAAPGSSDRYGVPAWGQLPSPGLRPEKSRGWDVGVDRSFLGGALTFSTTWFDNRFRDLIDWSYTDLQTLDGMYVNRSRASTQGVELGVVAQPLPSWHLRLGYTWLDGHDDDTGERLMRRPRNSADLSTWLDVTSRWTVGFGLRAVDDRVDSAGPTGNYSVARLSRASTSRTECLSR